MPRARSEPTEILHDMEPSPARDVTTVIDVLQRGEFFGPRTYRPPHFRLSLPLDDAGVPIAGGPP